MTMLEKYIQKSGYGVSINNPRTIRMEEVFAAIELAKEGKVGDWTFSDDAMEIVLAVSAAMRKAAKEGYKG